MLKALSQAPKGDPGPEPTSELPAQLPGLMVPLGLETFILGDWSRGKEGPISYIRCLPRAQHLLGLP